MFANPSVRTLIEYYQRAEIAEQICIYCIRLFLFLLFLRLCSKFSEHHPFLDSLFHFVFCFITTAGLLPSQICIAFCILSSKIIRSQYTHTHTDRVTLF